MTEPAAIRSARGGTTLRVLADGDLVELNVDDGDPVYLDSAGIAALMDTLEDFREAGSG
jgi:hypothetical protein